MNQLNQGTYELLWKSSPYARELGADWYSHSYPLFTSDPLSTIDDFWRIVAFAYSWMPTIPSIRPKGIVEPNLLLIKLQGLKMGDASLLPALLQELIPVINNSLTGVSKVLHFIAPDLVPIIDRNVLRGWDIFFFQNNPQYNVVKLPSYKALLTIKQIPLYLQYREVLLQWIENSGGEFSLRELEEAFFELGKYHTGEDIEVPLNLVF